MLRRPVAEPINQPATINYGDDGANNRERTNRTSHGNVGDIPYNNESRDKPRTSADLRAVSAVIP